MFNKEKNPEECDPPEADKLQLSFIVKVQFVSKFKMRLKYCSYQ